MQVDDPPYLSVGTAVSAKYKGAFCEAKVSKVERMVKCKVTFRIGLGAITVTDNEIKGTLRAGQLVQVKHPDRKELVEATITKIQDCSQYTVVFDDGDITTLRRTALCLKSGRHFNESETLDQLPLTHPEHFGNPVMGGRRGRRNRQLKDESSDEELEEENEPDLEAYTPDIGRVVSVETGENKRGKEKWFPGLVVIPSAQPTVKINLKDEFLIRSFRDDRYYTVPKKEVKEFIRDFAEKIESSGLAEAIQKAIKFLDHNELPLHWEKSSLFNTSGDSDSDENDSDTSDEEQSEEKDRFVAQLYKFMDDSGTPLNKTPVISNKDIDLHRLFLIVHKLGGYNRVTNQNKWKSVTGKMKLSVNQNISNQVKSVYKKCLLSYEAFHKTLGVTMLNPIRPKKTNKGRSLIRDKDRTPMSSPRPERDDDMTEKPLEKDKKETPVFEKIETKSKRKQEIKEKEAPLKKSKVGETSDTNSDVAEATVLSRPKRHESKHLFKERDKEKEKDKDKEKEKDKDGDKKLKVQHGDKVKVIVERIEDASKGEDKVQYTRSKSTIIRPKEFPKDMVTTRQSKEALSVVKQVLKPIKRIHKDEEEKDKKPKQRRKVDSEKSTDAALFLSFVNANVGDKLLVYYGPTNESKVTYEAKVVKIDKDQTGPIYLVHYTGWNIRYDEWIPAARIAENLSLGSKSRKSKSHAFINAKQVLGSPSNSSTMTKQSIPRRTRVLSAPTRGSVEEKPPRSTTPSSVTSSSSRTKSPATPATRSSRLAARQESSKKRRISAQTDISVQTDTDSDMSESETDLPRTRSGSIKTDEIETKVHKKKVSKTSLSIVQFKSEKCKESANDDEYAEKEDEEKVIKEKRLKKLKKSLVKSEGDSEDDDNSGHPRGRDFDLNQIRSELKGFSKALKAPSLEIEKDFVSSDDSSSNVNINIKEEKDEIKVKEEPKHSKLLKQPSLKVEKSSESSSEDIYEFKEPEPFEFESRPKLVDDKIAKKRLPRLFEEFDKSPKKQSGKSPLSPVGRSDKLDLPQPKTYSRIPKKIQISDNEDNEDEEIMEEELLNIDVKKEDPFDKLIESPCFNIVKTSSEKCTDIKQIQAMALEEPLSLFKELPDTSDEYSRDMDLSDTDMPTQIFTRSETLFTNTFSKSPPDRNTPDLEFSIGSKTDEGKTTNSDDDDIHAQIQRVIAQSSSTDDDSNDVLSKVSLSIPHSAKNSEEVKHLEIPVICTSDPTTESPVIRNPQVTPSSDLKEPDNKESLVVDIPSSEVSQNVKPTSPKKPIDPALQETDSSLLESIVSKPPLILNPKLDDTCKELTVKTGTKIADSILQKFNFIKNNMETKTSKSESSTSGVNQTVNLTVPMSSLDKVDTKVTSNIEKQLEPSALNTEGNINLGLETSIRSSLETILFDDEKSISKLTEAKGKLLETKTKSECQKQSLSKVETTETKRRRRVISKAYIDESDSDSSDSEHLIIAKLDDDSHTNSSDNKPLLESRINTTDSTSSQKTVGIDDAQSQPTEEKRSFNFDKIQPEKEANTEFKEAEITEKLKKGTELKDNFKEVQDPNLHSLLLCEEEIPRSPAPAPEPASSSDVSASISVHEMPFASAPGTSNSKILLEQKKPPVLPLLLPTEEENRSDAQTVIENTPPTTPESTISNLSPRGENGNMSPNSNDSTKSNEGEPDFSVHRKGAIKVSPYSEEDTQPGGDISTLKKSSDICGPPVSCRKRRRSLRTSEDSLSAPHVPAKRGRKPMPVRQRRDSDSDDASENSIAGSGGGTTPGSTFSVYERAARSPRPSKYNFFVEFDPSLDSTQRIAVLQQKLCELRKTYADVKAELAAVERRRKKIRRREREALKSAKQEMACA